MAHTPSRNDACHCGSGKKYKNCCSDKDQTKLTSKLGVAGILIVAILGAWLLVVNFSSDGGVQSCPEGTTWSEAHSHCH